MDPHRNSIVSGRDARDGPTPGSPGTAQGHRSVLSEPVNTKPVSWPVPHVIVTCMGLKSAWGRSELAALGYEGTFKRIRETFVLPDVHYYFNTVTRLKGTFHHVHGNGDQEPVLLHPLGWYELVQNLETIEVEFGYRDGYAIWDPLRLPKE